MNPRFHQVFAAFMLLAASLGLQARSADAAIVDPVVRVAGGQVSGRIEGSQAVFKGIPFAHPPVGDLRWREPQPVKDWQGVRSATEYGHACAQTNANWNRLAFENASEDCLYLNVWAPKWPGSGRAPVMVWIHGGGNNGGSAMGAGGIEPPFDGARLAARGVVVVTLNYRLGVFGFIGHPELTAESPHHASGAYGILDQIAALRWVRENITQFGGDPGNVTVFGQSAGAQDTSILVASPLARGLVHKAIVQSGSPMISDKKLLRPPQTARLGQVLAATLGAPAEGQVKYLRGLPTSKIMEVVPEFRKSLASEKLILDVGMDGYAIPAFPPSVYAAGGQAHIPMLVGNNGQDMPGLRAPPGATPEQVSALIHTRLEQVYGAYPDLLARAVAAAAAPSAYPPYGGPETQAGVDHSFRCTGVALARWHSAVSPVWQYEFTAGSQVYPPAHSAELDYVFGYLRDRVSDPVLVTLSDQMITYWTNFAKSGNPNGPGLPFWPTYEASARRYLEFSNDGPLEKTDLRAQTCPLYLEKLSRDLQVLR